MPISVLVEAAKRQRLVEQNQVGENAVGPQPVVRRAVVINQIAAEGFANLLPSEQSRQTFTLPTYKGPQELEAKAFVLCDGTSHKVEAWGREGYKDVSYEPFSANAAVGEPVSITEAPYEDTKLGDVTCQRPKARVTLWEDRVDFGKGNAVYPDFHYLGRGDKMSVGTGHFLEAPPLETEGGNSNVTVQVKFENNTPGINGGHPDGNGGNVKDTLVYLQDVDEADLRVPFPNHTFKVVEETDFGRRMRNLGRLSRLQIAGIDERYPERALEYGVTKKRTYAPEVAVRIRKDQETGRGQVTAILLGQGDYREIILESPEEPGETGAYVGVVRRARFNHKPVRNLDDRNVEEIPLVGRGDASIRLNESSPDRVEVSIRAYSPRQGERKG